MFNYPQGTDKLTFQIEKAYKIIIILGYYTFPRRKGLLSQIPVMVSRHQMPTKITEA